MYVDFALCDDDDMLRNFKFFLYVFRYSYFSAGVNFEFLSLLQYVADNWRKLEKVALAASDFDSYAATGKIVHYV